MKILKLEAENVKRLNAVTIEPNGNMVVIGGNNGAGKSSILDSIEYALGGTKHICNTPLRNGTEHGHIILETDMYTVKRTFTKDNTYIEVKTKEGYKITTPQELLNKLVGDLSFDPLEFTRMKPVSQVETLKNLLGLDFSKLDAEYAQVEADRRDIGRDGKQAKSLLDSIPLDPDAPDSEVVVSDLIKILDEAQIVNRSNTGARDRVKQLNIKRELLQDKVNSLREELEETEEVLRGALDSLSEANTIADRCVDVDIEPISKQIQQAEYLNNRFREAKQRKDYAAKYGDKLKEYEGLSARLREIESAKNDMISNAQFPVEGVAFSDSGILVNGIPFEQASSAEQLKIAVAMGLSSNPELRIVLIRDGSLLDADSLTSVAQMAEQYDAQVWMERVGEGQEVSVVIRDGMIYDASAEVCDEVA